MTAFRLWQCLESLALALLLSAQAVAAPAKTSDEAILATKAAIDAFFAMPAAQLGGTQRTEPPTGFDAEQASQGALIEFLDQQLAHGARLDRYRWGGTLLHHSLRISFYGVAQWLLDHGADPLQKLQPVSNAEGLDALGIAVRLERWAWVSSLLKHPAYQKLTAAERAERLWAGAMGDAQVQGLLRLRPIVPLPGLVTPAGQSLLSGALCGHQFDLIARLISDAKAPSLPARVECSGDQLPTKPIAWTAELPVWISLDARFDAPVLPWLLPSIRTPAELQAVLASSLRQPWGDPVFVRSMLFHAPPSVLASLLLGSKPGLAVLWPEFDRRQGNQLWGRPVSEWAAVVRAAPDLQELLGTAEAGYNGSLDARAGKPGAAEAWAQRWTPLVQRIDALSPAQRRHLKLPVGLLRQLPPQFMASGLRWAAEADVLPEMLPEWLAGASLAEVQAAWPLLKAGSPELAKDMLGALLTPLLADPPSGRLHQAMRGFNARDDMLPKFRWLRAQGLTAPRRVLAIEQVPRDGDDGSCCRRGLVDWALGEKLVSSPVPVAFSGPGGKPAIAQRADRLRLIAAEPACKPVVSVALRRALAAPSAKVPDSGDRVYDDVSLQPLSAPGRAECLWLRSERAYSGSISWDELDFFEGVSHFNPCGDGAGRLSVWDEAQKGFVTISEADPMGQLVESELLAGGALWLSTEIEGGRCGRSIASAQLLNWKAGLPVFDFMPVNDPRQVQWQTACPADHLRVCLKLATDDGSPTPAPPPRVPISPQEFVARHLSAERADFIAAFDRLDRPHLEAHQRDGLFSEWLDQGVQALGQSARPLAEKRARMAWLLAQPGRAAALSAATLASLTTWLPTEDWRPLIEPRRCGREFGNRWQLSQLGEKAPADLARRIAVALARDCNGEVR